MPSDGSKTLAQERRLVHFSVNGRAYAIDIHRIQEIIFSRDATPIPMSPSFILGVIELRGKIIPVISLRARFGLTAGKMDLKVPSNGNSSHILVIRIGVWTIGLIVDEVREVVNLHQGAIHPPDQFFTGEECKYLESIGRLNDQLILILDLDQLLSLEDLKLLEQG
ncbi:MAG: chemotaxis protein CheW [Nitrospiria bacterium]